MIIVGTTAVRLRSFYPGEYPDADGLFYVQPMEIAIRPGLTGERQAEVLIHECIHAIWHINKLPRRPTEERVCTSLGEALAALFRDNPEILAAIEAALQDNTPIIH